MKKEKASVGGGKPTNFPWNFEKRTQKVTGGSHGRL
jgi:hypothetical protein